MFGLSLRYSIYKVQSLKPGGFNSFILSHLVSFVKNFFRSFSNFFDVILTVLHSRFRWIVHHAELFQSITFNSVCQELYSSFFKLLRSDLILFVASFSLSNSHMISQDLQLVKHFFLFFWSFPLHHHCLADSLHILPFPPGFVKHFFKEMVFYGSTA